MGLIRIFIILSFAITILIGLFVGKKIRGKTENYIVAGRSWSFIFVALALLSQAIDGNATLGNTQLSHDFGFWAGASLPIGLAISLFLLGKFFAGHLNSLKLTTIVDLFEQKYSRNIGFIVSIILLFGFGVLLAGNIAAVGILLKLFFPIKYESAVILIALVVLLYSIRGGIISDIYTDILQLISTFLGIFLTLMFLITSYGFIDFEFISTSGKFALNQLSSITDGALINWATIAALGFGNLIAIDFASRILSAKSPSDAKKGATLLVF